MKSWWVNHELQTAVQKEARLSKERGQHVYAMIPLDLDGYLFDPGYEGGIKVQLHERLAADFKGWKTDNDKFEAQLRKVIKALKLGGWRSRRCRGCRVPAK